MGAWFSQERDLKPCQRKRLLEDLQALPYDLEETLTIDVSPMVKALERATSMFVLGKGPCHPAALEASLKLKEMAYLHAEGFEGSSLKHGPFALLTSETPVLLLMPRFASYGYEKMLNGLEEIHARHAPLVVLSDQPLPDSYKVPHIPLPTNESFGFLLSLVPVQKAALALALAKGIDPDYPRNLAKVVTVE
jgi:glucosamine--fructose-6-phosphate aminotransferase (isomerizing)